MSQIPTFILSTKKRFKRSFILLLMFCFALNSLVGQKSVRDSLKLDLKLRKSQLHSNLNDSLYINTLNELAVFMRFHKLDSLQILSQEALKHSKLIAYDIGEINSYLGIGAYFSDRGDHEKGIMYYQKALETSKKLQNDNLLLHAINRLAGEFEYQGEYAMALEQMLEGIEIANGINHKQMLAILNENIALLYATQNEHEEALEYFQEVKRLNLELVDQVSSATSLSNLANIYAEMDQYDYAMFNANSSITVLEEHEVMDVLAFAYEVKGKIYLRQQKFIWAMYWFNQSKMLHDKMVDDERSRISLLQGISLANLGLDKDDVALDFAQQAFDLSTKLGVTEGIKNAAESLYKLAKRKGDLSTALSYHELFQKLTDTINQNKSKKTMMMLHTKIDHDQQKDFLVKETEEARALQKKYVTSFLGIFLVLIIILFLIKRNEKIQKDLNKELSSKKELLEKSESELLELNDTKNKLFSIIGHDLKGPIGAFQGILELFKSGEVKTSEFLTFIPKLGADIEHISFTLNNLLSWGQAQMNGSKTNPTAFSVDTVIQDNFNLLSEIAAAKSIKLTNQVGSNSMVWSDINQIDIVVRNLISNALKFTPENGMISIGATEENEYWKISVKDTGVGIPEEIKEKLFSKNDTVTTYGTNEEKGTGLGLMLCKEMVEKNNGKIWVDSKLNRGSCFYFTVPKSHKKYNKAS